MSKGHDISDTKEYGLLLSKRTFLGTAVMLFCVMIFAFSLTQIIPTGEYQRVFTDGREVVVAGSYAETGITRLPLWRLFTAPFEVFAGPDAMTAIMIILSIILIGGVFLILDKCGLMQYAMRLVIHRFEKRKYVLLAAVTLFCMLLGAGMGVFEESVVLAPIAVALAISLGWDALVGAGMSLLAVGFGFTAGLFNPFSIGVAQRLAGLPLFSGLWLRAIVFVVIYALLLTFLILYARRIEKDPKKSLTYGIKTNSVFALSDETPLSEMDAGETRRFKRALTFFGICLFVIAIYVACGIFIPELTDFVMPVIALMITIGGIGAGLISGYSGVLRDFGKGIVALMPSVVLIMLALSVKHIFVSGGIMDTLLLYAYNLVTGSAPLTSLYIVFLFVLGLEFFIGGASAKAFLIIPLLAPLAELIDLSRQSIVLAFSFGDGFANVIYPTNAVLLIVLGILGVPYLTWFKWTWKLQAALVIISIGFLTLAHTVGYGPF